jgi:hypothetical protein
MGTEVTAEVIDLDDMTFIVENESEPVSDGQ